MRIAVAGSTGQLGRAVVADQRRQGHEVIRLVRGGTDGPDTIAWDPSYGRLPTDALDGVDAVVNFYGTGLGGKRWNKQRRAKIRDSRVGPAATLAEAAAKAGVGVLLNASGVAVYGDTGAGEVDEHAATGGDFLATTYRDWELATAPASDAGVRVVLLRLGALVGPGGAVGRLAPAFRWLLGGRLGDGRQYVSWISLADALGAVSLLLGDGGATVSGPVNLTSPGPVTNREFVRALGAAVRRPTPLAYPRPLVRAALGGFADATLLTSHRALPGVLTEQEYAFRHPELASALGEYID